MDAFVGRLSDGGLNPGESLVENLDYPESDVEEFLLILLSLFNFLLVVLGVALHQRECEHTLEEEEDVLDQPNVITHIEIDVFDVDAVLQVIQVMLMIDLAVLSSV